MSTSKLFQPFKLGSLYLQHRVVLSPLTRFRALPFTHVVKYPLVKDYYSQRSSLPGTLIITEGVPVAAKAGGWRNVPGIWSDEQIGAWRKVTDAVHGNGSYAFMQLFAMGRAADPAVLLSESPDQSNPWQVVAPSAIPLSNTPDNVPRELTVPEMREYVDLFGQAAAKAVRRANFDGVEIQIANGYLLDQFLSDKSNKRTDEYGGSIGGRVKFPLEVLDRVVREVGAQKVGVRLSPWTPFQEVFMDDPIPTYTHLIENIKKKHADLAYLHLIEPEITGSSESSVPAPDTHSNEFIRKIWAPRPIISAGDYTRESAIKRAEEGNELVAFGRWFISNPDLPTKLKNGWKLTPFNRETFYTGDVEDAHVGYTDYPFAKEETSTVGRPQDVVHRGRAEL